MGIQNFIKAEKGDPDWLYTPDKYINKEFKIIDGKTIELTQDQSEFLILRQTPNEKEILAKHLKINLKPNSKLDLYVINEADTRSQQIFIYDIIINPNSELNLSVFLKNGRLNKHIFQIYMHELSNFNLTGMIMNTVGGDTELITKSVQEHPDAQSNQYVAGLAGKDSQTVFQATSILENEGHHGESYIESNNLILDPTGRCFSKPEIYNHCSETRTSYGTETTTLDRSRLYYLLTRGFSKKEAMNFVCRQFQEQILDLIPMESIRQEVKGIFETD